MKKQNKVGRPALNTKRVKVTIDLSPSTFAKLSSIRQADGRSLGRIIDTGEFVSL